MSATTTPDTPPRTKVAEKPRSPATKQVRTLVGVGFVVVWLIAVMVDFFFQAEPVLPVWFHLMGMLVLGFVLGISSEDLPTISGGAR